MFGSHEHHLVGNACDAEIGNVQGLGEHIAVEIVIEQFAELGGIDVLGFPSIIGISNAGHACKVVCFPISRGERGESWRDSFTFQSSITIQLRPHPARMLVPLSFSAGNGFCFSYTFKDKCSRYVRDTFRNCNEDHELLFQKLRGSPTNFVIRVFLCG